MNNRQKMINNIAVHGNNLNKIFHTVYDDSTLSKKLFRLEVKAHRLATEYCNGDIDSDKWELLHDEILGKVNKILSNKSIPIRINADCRGYTLKIDDEYVRANNLSIYRDWGGYGILAPDFREGGK